MLFCCWMQKQQYSGLRRLISVLAKTLKNSTKPPGTLTCALSHSCARFNFLYRCSSLMENSGLIDGMYGF